MIALPPKRVAKRSIFKSLCLAAFILLIMAPVGLAVLMIESKALVRDRHTMNTQDTVNTRDFVNKTLRVLLRENHRQRTLTASESELNGLLAVGARTLKGLRGVVSISPELFEAETTLKIPKIPLKSYLNIRFQLAPSTSGFQIQQLKIGTLSFPEPIVRFTTITLLDLALGEQKGKDLLAAINFVSLEQGRIAIGIDALPELDQLVEKMKGRFRQVRDEVALLGDPQDIRPYYQEIINTHEQLPKDQALSLSYYIQPLFKLAVSREGDPVDENRAAILALGMALGSWRVEQMAGQVRSTKMKKTSLSVKKVGLAQRPDLRLHFLISAVLQIASEQGITHAIGEFKELLDAGKGGSGFSFADLAADRAGVRFAVLATEKETARSLQEQLAQGAGEALFFPDIAALPEGLSQKTFEYYFTNIDSPRYKKLVNRIDECIQQLPIHRQKKTQDPAPCDLSDAIPEALSLSSKLNR